MWWLWVLQVLQPFDSSKFNFTKALQKEVLFQFEASDMPGKVNLFPALTLLVIHQCGAHVPGCLLAFDPR